MKISLDSIDDVPFTWNVETPVAAPTLERHELLGLSPIDWRGSISRLPTGYLLQAQFGYRQTLTCDRCLGEIEEPVDDRIDLLVLTEMPDDVTAEHELQEEDLGVLYVDGEEVDLDPLLVEQIQLNIPMKPLCRTECAGLCGTCGADLNKEECGCEDELTDPRWDALAALRDQMTDDSKSSAE